MKVKLLDLKKQYESIKAEIDKAIADVINNCAFIQGKFVEEFEENFKNYIGAKFCIGVANGTDSLEISLWAMDLPKGSEVIVPANSYIATSESVTNMGLKVVFADCDTDYTISLDSLKKKITPNTSAIIPVHLYGQPARMKEILKIAADNNLKVLEDAAQAHGARLNNQIVGTFGVAGSFSFYPGKNLGAYGDAGGIVTNSEEFAEKCRMYGNHGSRKKYEHEFEGRNSRLDGLQAAILNVKLKYLDRWLTVRNEVAKFYNETLINIGIDLPIIRDNIYHAWHLYVIRHPERDKLKDYLAENGIETGIHYPTALPKLKAYQYIRNDLKESFACKTDTNLLSLPMGEHLTRNEIGTVVEKIKIFQDNSK